MGCILVRCCDGEVIEISKDDGVSWEYVVDCTESLEYTFECIAIACDLNYKLI